VKYAGKISSEDLESGQEKKVVFIVPNSFIYCNIGLMLVGIGSWFFHMTLLYPMQLLDELPMIWSTSIVFFSYIDLIVSTNKNNSNFKVAKSVLATLAILYSISIPIIYVFFIKSPLFFQASYAVLCLGIIIASFTTIFRFNLSFWLYVLCAFYCSMGFFLWNIDNNFCTYLTTYREFLDSFLNLSPYPSFLSILLNVIIILLKSLSEFHALWHLSSGYGCYLVILILIEANYEQSIKEASVKNQMMKPRPTKRNFFSLLYHLNNKFLHEHKLM
jgi:dihydroceramidase